MITKEQKSAQQLLIRTAALNYEMSHEELARMLDTPYATFAKWSTSNRMPAGMAVMLQAMVLIPALRAYLKKRVK